jgi:hypothetical protein
LNSGKEGEIIPDWEARIQVDCFVIQRDGRKQKITLANSSLPVIV